MTKRAYRRHRHRVRRLALGDRFGDNSAMRFRFDINVDYQKMQGRVTTRVQLGEVYMVLYNRILRVVEYKGERYCWIDDDVTYGEWLQRLSTINGGMQVEYQELLWHLNRFLLDQSTGIISPIMDEVLGADKGEGL